MASPNRTARGVSPLWFLAAASGLFVALGVVQAGLRLNAGASQTAALIDFTLVAGPGFALLYGTYRVSRSSIHASLYARITGWALGGIVLMLGVVWLLTWNPAGSLDHPLRAAVIGVGIGANGGFLVGTNEAQSIVRADEAEERTQELARTNRELEETKAELQETVAQLERSNERLEQFAYAASHDLQEPLRMVSSYLRLLEDRYDDDLDEEAHEYIEFAVDGADRMRAMVDGLLQYSRVQSEGDPVGPVDLDEVLADARDDLAVRIEATDAEIEADPLPVVEGDENQLRQVFQNLLENAIKYSGDEPPRIDVSAERSDDGDWRVAVGDDGIGVDPDHHDRIFQMFKQLQSGEDGAGIGLPLCKRVVERHGGEMWLDSEPGDGSTFHVTLPAAEESAERRATATAGSEAAR
ncbi:histidine kinase [Natronomonas salina]|uniref:ATP-binding protein n=1 Tax=Natronomonas salina TaxID=1710540 RepID=UPI001FE7E04B|nr:ATP-binding protein [Natronomonas salina]QLD89291.1 histidine kinase [Natronomonas salina]